MKEIGAGACSRVWLARWEGKQVAVKMFNEAGRVWARVCGFQLTAAAAQNYAAFSEKEFGSELAIMSVLRHPNICHVRCAVPGGVAVRAHARGDRRSAARRSPATASWSCRCIGAARCSM